MKPDKVIYEEVPYAYTIRFEGKVVVPVNIEEQALFEVKKAIEKAMERFEVWDGKKIIVIQPTTYGTTDLRYQI